MRAYIDGRKTMAKLPVLIATLVQMVSFECQLSVGEIRLAGRECSTVSASDFITARRVGRPVRLSTDNPLALLARCRLRGRTAPSCLSIRRWPALPEQSPTNGKRVSNVRKKNLLRRNQALGVAAKSRCAIVKAEARATSYWGRPYNMPRCRSMAINGMSHGARAGNCKLVKAAIELDAGPRLRTFLLGVLAGRALPKTSRRTKKRKLSLDCQPYRFLRRNWRWKSGPENHDPGWRPSRNSG